MSCGRLAIIPLSHYFFAENHDIETNVGDNSVIEETLPWWPLQPISQHICKDLSSRMLEVSVCVCVQRGGIAASYNFAFEAPMYVQVAARG